MRVFKPAKPGFFTFGIIEHKIYRITFTTIYTTKQAKQYIPPAYLSKKISFVSSLHQQVSRPARSAGQIIIINKLEQGGHSLKCRTKNLSDTVWWQAQITVRHLSGTHPTYHPTVWHPSKNRSTPVRHWSDTRPTPIRHYRTKSQITIQHLRGVSSLLSGAFRCRI